MTPNIQYNRVKQMSVADAVSRSGLIAGIKIKQLQKDDEKSVAIIQNIDQQDEFRDDDDGILWQGTKLCVLEDPTLREALMTEAHSSPFSIHPEVKNEHQVPKVSGLLQPFRDSV
ncbi:hypothetical protein Tco_0933541 [Tanacetum coccineum]